MPCSPDEPSAVFQDIPGGVTFAVSVLPRSSKCCLAGRQEGSLRVKLTRPPVDGEANSECCRFFAKLLSIPKSQVSIIRGDTSRHKILRAAGISAAEAHARMSSALESP